MSTARTTISMPEESYQQALKRVRDLRYKNFSEYIQHLVLTDTLHGGDHIRETGALHETNSSPGRTEAEKVIAEGVAHARASDNAKTAPNPRSKYPPVRRSKKQRPTEPKAKPDA